MKRNRCGTCVSGSRSSLRKASTVCLCSRSSSTRCPTVATLAKTWMASYTIMKVYEDRFGETYPDMAWEPKAAFRALADYYRG
jgi:hypothetical protein